MENTRSLIEEFKAQINNVTATFIDARNGFEILYKSLLEEADRVGWNQPINYSDTKKQTVLVATTLGERIDRNACDAENCTFIGNMALVTIYSYWDDYYRKEIAKSLGVEKNELKSDVFGDIKNLRVSITHHRSIAKKEVEKNKILKWFFKEDEIFLSVDMYKEMVRYIFDYLDSITE